MCSDEVKAAMDAEAATATLGFWRRVLTSSKKVLLEQWPGGEHERRESRGTPELPGGSVDRVASALCLNRAACTDWKEESGLCVNRMGAAQTC